MSRSSPYRGPRCPPLLVALLVAGGCGSSYRPPPTAGASTPPARAVAGPRAIVIGKFRNPDFAPRPWPDIGSGMSEAVASALLNEGRLDVWLDPPIAGRVAALLEQPKEKRTAGLRQLRRDHEDVRFVVVGKVTDFAHTTDVPASAQRKGIFGRRHEAVVALRFLVVDLDVGRVVVSDHVHGTAGAPKGPSQELYANMSFGTYLFWSTPLGQASEEVVARTATVLETVVPQLAAPIRIAGQVGPRELRLSREIHVPAGTSALYHVCIVNDSGEERLVLDPDSRLPLGARLEGEGRATTTAWLVGRKPLSVDLRGAILHPALPEARSALAGPAAAR